MTKSIEATIALMMLFIFVFSAIQLNTQQSTLTIGERNKDIIHMKAQQDNFRNLVDNKDVNKVYDFLDVYLDIAYTIKICDYISSDCVYNDYDILSYKNTKSVNYYFADTNKTLSVMFGYN